MAKTSSGTWARRARRSASEWRAEVTAWRASGLSASKYADGRGVHAGTLMGWASRLERQVVSTRVAAKRGPSSFLPVRVSEREAPSDERARVSAEVVLACGRTVRLGGELRLDQLGALLDAVEGRREC
jgi:hypothetical protein